MRPRLYPVRFPTIRPATFLKGTNNHAIREKSLGHGAAPKLKFTHHASVNLNADPMVGPTLSQEAVGVCVFQYKDERVKFFIWDTAGFERNFDIIPNK